MKEVTGGDIQRIEEIRLWMSKGIEVTEVRERLEELGYSEYHIAFLLEEATGLKFLPEKPSILVNTMHIRIAAIVVAAGILGVVLWWYFLR